MHVCIYLYVLACMCIRVSHVCDTCVCVPAHVCASRYMCVRTFDCVCVCVCVCVYVCVGEGGVNHVTRMSHITYMTESCHTDSCQNILMKCFPHSLHKNSFPHSLPLVLPRFLSTPSFQHTLSPAYSWQDVGGWGRDPRKQTDFCTTVKKRPKQKISWVLDVGVCYSITGTRFPYYISLSTISWARGNGNVFGTNRTSKWVRNWNSEGRVSTVWIFNPAPHVSSWQV